MFFTQQINDFWVKTCIISSLSVILLIIIFATWYFSKQNTQTEKRKEEALQNILSINQDILKQK